MTSKTTSDAPLEASTEGLELSKRPSSSADSEIRPQRNSKLSYADINLALQLREKGYTQVQLAEFFGVRQSSISKVLSKFSVDTRHLAKLRLASQADRVARAALKAMDKAALEGEAEPALELLDRMDIAVKKRAEGGGGSKVTIVIGSGGAAVPDLPIIDVEPTS